MKHTRYRVCVVLLFLFFVIFLLFTVIPSPSHWKTSVFLAMEYRCNLDQFICLWRASLLFYRFFVFRHRLPLHNYQKIDLHFCLYLSMSYFLSLNLWVYLFLSLLSLSLTSLTLSLSLSFCPDFFISTLQAAGSLGFLKVPVYSDIACNTICFPHIYVKYTRVMSVGWCWYVSYERYIYYIYTYILYIYILYMKLYLITINI